MRLLFLSQWFPYPPDNGSKIRVHNILRELAQQHEVTLVSFVTDERAAVNSSPLQSLCRAIHAVPWRPYNPRSPRAMLGYFSLKPRYVIDTLSPYMLSVIEELVSTRSFDLVIASELGMAGYASAFHGLPALFEELEQGFYYHRYRNASTPQQRLRNGLTWFKQKLYIARLLRSFKAVTVVSQPERDLLRQVAPGFEPVEVIPNGVNLADYAGIHTEPRPNSLVFCGALTFKPNHAAMSWFIEKVYPQVRATIPGVELTITGSHAGSPPLPISGGVRLTGFLEDIRPEVASSWASLAPIHAGGGTRLKIIEAMALNTPVIATTKGAEGIEARPGVDILIADTPDDYAQAVIRLMKDPALRQELASNAYHLVRQKYDWAVLMPRLNRLVERIVGSKPALQPVPVDPYAVEQDR